MGRTVPTFRNIIESFGWEWNDFKRALRNIDREAFEELMNHARRHASAGSNMSNPNPFEPVVMSILYFSLFATISSIIAGRTFAPRSQIDCPPIFIKHTSGKSFFCGVISKLSINDLLTRLSPISLLFTCSRLPSFSRTNAIKHISSFSI